MLFLVARITDPSLIMLLSGLLHAFALVIVSTYRIITYNQDNQQFYQDFIDFDIYTKSYWVVLGFVGLLYIYSFFSFLSKTVKLSEIFIKYSYSFIPIISSSIILIIYSLLGLFSSVNYDLIRVIIGSFVFLGSIALFKSLNQERKIQKSKTLAARLEILTYVAFLLIIWVLVATLAGVFRIGADFGSFRYFLPPISIGIFNGTFGVLVPILFFSMVKLPKRIRKKYNITSQRFDSIFDKS